MIQPVSNSNASAKNVAQLTGDSIPAVTYVMAVCGFAGWLVGERVGSPVTGTVVGAGLGVGLGLAGSSAATWLRSNS